MKRLLICLIIAQVSLTFAHASGMEEQNVTKAKQDIEALLDSFHEAAAVADLPIYFNAFAEGATFLGTDVSEVWDIPTYRKIVENSGTKGWVYIKRHRDITVASNASSAWFHEVLDSVKYGTSRGTGTLIKTNKGWKIVQYHLSFPIPNQLSKEFTAKIREHEGENR